MNRRLYRCRHDRRLAGVAAGVAEFFDLDPTLVRILWFLSIFFGGLGLFVYIGLALIVPLEPLTAAEAEAAAADADAAVATGSDSSGHRHAARREGPWTTFIGIGLILLGSIALLDQLLPAWVHPGRWIFPGFLIAIGAILVWNAVRRQSEAS